MWQRLARRLLSEPDFRRRSFLFYLLLPLTGLLAGVLSLFLVTLPAPLLVNYAATRSLALAETAASPTFIALALLLAWVAGYYQEAALAKFKPSAATAETKSLSLPAEKGADLPLAFKAWAAQRRRMIRWSNTWGVFILIYGLAWLMALLAGLLWSGSLFPAPADQTRPLLNLLTAGWPAIMAGGLGGVIGMFYELYRRISFARDFDPHHSIAYLVLPLTGLVLGGAMYLFIASGYLSIEALSNEAPPVVDTPAVIAAYLVLGWLAGFRQQSLHGLIWRLIQAVIGFFRFCLSLVSPKLLWDQSKRADALSEVAQQRELFRPVERTTVKRKL
jgi:hypothetical protein